MNILVTGCCGFIGTNLVLKLLELEYNIFGVDNFDDYYDINQKMFNLSEMKKYKNFKFYHQDFSDILDTIYPSDKIDVVIHLAAFAGVRNSMKNPSKYFNNNVYKSIILLEKTKIYQINKIIFASSSSVYGNIKDLLFTENNNLSHKNILSYYALSKKHLEEIMYFFSKDNNINVIGFRFFTVYGPRCRPDMAVHKFLFNIFHQKKITIYGNGNTMRDYTYVEDIVNGIILGLKNISKFKYEIFNLGSNKNIMLKNMVKMCESVVKKNALVEYSNIPKGDVNYTFSDNSKSKKLLGYEPKTSFKEGLGKTFIWLKHYYKI